MIAIGDLEYDRPDRGRVLQSDDARDESDDDETQGTERDEE